MLPGDSSAGVFTVARRVLDGWLVPRRSYSLLVIGPLALSACASVVPRTQGGDAGSVHGDASAAPDAPAAPDAASACLAATEPCDGSDCCAGLVCGDTSLGHVCCGEDDAPCATTDGSDCCGDRVCVDGRCQTPAACRTGTEPCTGDECCAGLVCGDTSLGHVCCGNAGAPCATTDGTDCCGLLECVSGQCVDPYAGVLSACTESAILAAAPTNAVDFIQRALDWVHRAALYSQLPQAEYGGYRTDCSGLVAMAWGRPAPGETTYAYAGGPWDDGSSVALGSWDEIRIGDATNYPGDPDTGTGHIRLFAGWLDRAHTSYCSIEEYDYGHPAEVRSHTLDRSIYLPIRLAGFTPTP